jgi:hypothetical protein
MEVLLNVYDVVPPSNDENPAGGTAAITRLNNLVRRPRAGVRRARPCVTQRAAHAAGGVGDAASRACSGMQCALSMKHMQRSAVRLLGRMLTPTGPAAPPHAPAPSHHRPTQTRGLFGGVGGVFHGAIVLGDVEWSFGYCVSSGLRRRRRGLGL